MGNALVCVEKSGFWFCDLAVSLCSILGQNTLLSQYLSPHPGVMGTSEISSSLMKCMG